MAAGRENFIFFLCPLDGVRFNEAIGRRSFFHHGLSVLLRHLSEALDLGVGLLVVLGALVDLQAE
ncbi:hypothetical protein, partial [Intestinimonas butyriciproducens]|uniref:hypothetical protein n=1 Tax=Intestinimonas butyriciproducens TaxID=1297617 RepID=UPI001A9B285A